jgi:hypothetical protein
MCVCVCVRVCVCGCVMGGGSLEVHGLAVAVIELIHAGADINTCDPIEQMTPLMLAAKQVSGAPFTSMAQPTTHWHATD